MNIAAFENHSEDYDEWFKKNKFVYLSELEAVKHFLSGKGKSFEIGAGTGKFIEPLKINFGIDPSFKMINTAKKNLLSNIICGIGETLPIKKNIFNNVILVTAICFVDNPDKTILESHRILKKNGKIIIAFVDKESKLGKIYQLNKNKSKFYSQAVFYSTGDIVALLVKYNFKNIRIIQTVFGDYKKISEVQNFKYGFGEGNFIVVCGEKIED